MKSEQPGGGGSVLYLGTETEEDFQAEPCLAAHEPAMGAA